MGIPSGNHVNSSGITKQAFIESLERQGVIQGTNKFEQAMSIFNRYAGVNSTEEKGQEVLDDVEQGLVRNAMNDMDTDENGTVSKKEYNQSDVNMELQQNGQPKITYKGYKAFLNALNGTTENGGWYNDEVAVSENYKGNDFSLVGGNSAVRNYRVGNSPSAVTNAPADNQPPELPAPPVQPISPQVTYQNIDNLDAAKKFIYQYLLQKNDVTDDDIKFLNSMNALQGLAIEYSDESKDKVTVKFGDKTFYLRVSNNDDITVNTEGENPSDLRSAILTSNTTDTQHSYQNRYGKTGNSQSTYRYDQPDINNTNRTRRHVNPVQTFSSMLLNNTEKSTLEFRNNLTGEDIIDVIAEPKRKDKDKGITLSELIRYLKSAVDEAAATTQRNLATGVRIAAKDVDMDLKDLNNLGLVFKKFDTNNNGYLDKDELDALIKALTTKNKTMTSLAREQNTVQQPAKPEPAQTETPIPDLEPVENNDGESATVQQTQYGGRVSSPDRTRNVAGTNGAEQVQYMYNDGRRTLVEPVGNEYRTVLNANIAEYEDHGPLGAGRKDFIKIDGLRSNVRAEVVSGQLQGDMVIKIKDANGTVTYRKISYNTKTKTYKLGALCDEQGNEQSGKPQTATQLLQALGMDSDTMEVPDGLIVKKKHGKNVYYLNGHKVPENVARAHVLAYNATNNPTYINGFKGRKSI